MITPRKRRITEALKPHLRHGPKTALVDAIDVLLAEAEQAERDRLVPIIEDAIENAEMSLPRGEDPHYGLEVRRLGDAIGYGAMMASASAAWEAKHGPGAFCAGPCVGTAKRWLEKARNAIRARGQGQAEAVE